MNSLKSLNPFFWKHRKILSWGVLFIILSNFFAIYQIQFIGKTLDSIQHSIVNKSQGEDEQIRSLIISGSIIIGTALLSGFFTFMMRQTIIVASRNIEYDLKNKIYKHYQELSLTFYKDKTVGDLMNRLSEDVVAVRMYLGPGVMYIANLLILFVITAFYMFLSDAEMALWTLLPLPILSYAIYKVSAIINKKSKIMQKSQSAISTFVQDSFSGIRVIKFFNKERYFEKKYGIKVENYKSKSLDLAKVEAYFSTIMILVIGFLYTTVLLIGGGKYIMGEISVGKIVDFFLYINKLIVPFSLLGWVTSVNQRAEASMQRVNEFLDKNSEIVNSNQEKYDIIGNIEFRNVSYTYPNTGIKAIENLSFTVNAGESIMINGKTGSGKSTIALLLCRLIDPSEGQILLDGKNLKEHNLDVVRDHLGYVPQESFLFSDTIENNIGFAIDNPQLSEIKHYAKQADVDENIKAFKNQYQTVVGERGVMLSGGQKQRICIARALIKKPKILIFDDCLSALDAKTEKTILENIETEIKNHTLIFISHRPIDKSKINKTLVLK